MLLEYKIGEGQEAEVYTCGEHTVLKLFRDASYAEKAHAEFERMKAVHAQGLPSPAVYECTTVNGRPGYSMEYIEGRSLLSSLLDNVLSARKTAVRFASIQAQIHTATVPGNLKPEKESLEWCIMHAGLSGTECAYGLQLLKAAPEGSSLCHGDYNLTNVIINKKNEPVVIDWGAAACGFYISDVANAVLMIKNGAVRGRINPAVRLVLALFRKNLAGMYLKAYRHLHTFSDKELHDWEVIRSMVRLAYCSEAEKPALLKFIHTCFAKPEKVLLF